MEHLNPFDFHIDNNKIGNFESDGNGNFITTMKVPENISGDRVEFKVKNNQGEEKVVSLRLGDNQNRIEKLEDVKITINGIEQCSIERRQFRIIWNGITRKCYNYRN